MHTAENEAFDIQKLLLTGDIEIHFQPIISVKRNTVVGIEALVRGIGTEGLLPPGLLFEAAKRNGVTVELDRLCRNRALQHFHTLNRDQDEFILFLNLEASIIDMDVVGSGHLYRRVTELGLNPASIAIEINEAGVENTAALQKFIETYRGYGFLIALDDVGAGHSNLNRLSVVKPDILKIDMALIRNIDKEFYKQEVVKALVGLARKIGALVVAEGIETQEEAITALEHGVDMLQGYFIERPKRLADLDRVRLKEIRRSIAAEFKQYTLRKLVIEEKRKAEYEQILERLGGLLTGCPIKVHGSLLQELVHMHDGIECVYILDERGVQLSDTVFSSSPACRHKSRMFLPAAEGTDHSLKSYYFRASTADHGKHISEPYISLASGNLCRTLSMKLVNNEEQVFILCVDTKYEWESA